MTESPLEIIATPRPIAPDQDVDTPLFTLVWRAIQRWIQERARLAGELDAAVEKERQAWITLADEWYSLKKVYIALVAGMAVEELTRQVQGLELSVRRLEQALQLQGVEVIAPRGYPYSPKLAEILECVEQIPSPDIEESLVHSVPVPAIRYRGQVIRCGRAIIAVPEQKRTVQEEAQWQSLA